MNISNMKNFVNAKNDILKCFAHAVAQATDVSVAGARIYRWRNEMFRRHVAQAKRIFYAKVVLSILAISKTGYC